MVAQDDAAALARTIAAIAEEKIAEDVIIIDVSDELAITDCFVIASAANDRQVNAIVYAIEEQLTPQGIKPQRKEGGRDGRWILLDYIDVVVHVLHNEERQYYSLERLWHDCPRISAA